MVQEMERAFPGVGELNESKVVLAPLSKNRGRMRQQLALFLSGVGVLLLLYVFCQYWQMYAAQRKLALEWQRQDARPATIAGSDGDALVRLTIAKINLDAVIVEGTSCESLKLGPGHMEDSALPGSSGNSVIVAHRDTSSVISTSCRRGMGFTSGDRAKFTDSRLPDVVSSSLRISRPYDSLLQRSLR
jgi:Sortase domain